MKEQEIIIDTYLCNGCGSCVEICPGVFKMDELSEKAVLINPKPEITDKVLEAIAYCPESCIELV